MSATDAMSRGVGGRDERALEPETGEQENRTGKAKPSDERLEIRTLRHWLFELYAPRALGFY